MHQEMIIAMIVGIILLAYGLNMIVGEKVFGKFIADIIKFLFWKMPKSLWKGLTK